MSENQVCKHLNKIKTIKSIYNQTTIFREENNALIFNLKFLVEQYEYKDEYADLPF